MVSFDVLNWTARATGVAALTGLCTAGVAEPKPALSPAPSAKTVRTSAEKRATRADSVTPVPRALPATQTIDVPGGGERVIVNDVAVSPRLTPRGSDIPLYPAPAIVTQAGFLGPYGVGLAAAAPVGTPYLRSPAFAGPPIIYMPQTVTRVLLPGATPYPANIMAPPVRYAYSSAPFTRTDIYVNLPYGTYYWPNGYAGTTPVEPQIPAYLTAPATAVLTSEAAYTTSRYAPGAAAAETLNPITIPPSAAAGSSTVADTAVTRVETAEQATTKAGGPGVPASGNEATGVSGSSIAPAGQATSTLDALPALAPLPSIGTNNPPSAGSSNSSNGPLPNLALAGIFASDANSAGSASGAAPVAADAGKAATVGPNANSDKAGIIVDDKTPGGLVLDPQGDWLPSKNAADSYEGSSVYVNPQGSAKKATFKATIPEAGQYDVLLWWPGASREFRSSSVPVTITTANGPVKMTIDQTLANRQFNSLGTFPFKAGPEQEVVTISTEGLDGASASVTVSVDALKLVKVP